MNENDKKVCDGYRNVIFGMFAIITFGIGGTFAVIVVVGLIFTTAQYPIEIIIDMCMIPIILFGIGFVFMYMMPSTRKYIKRDEENALIAKYESKLQEEERLQKLEDAKKAFGKDE